MIVNGTALPLGSLPRADLSALYEHFNLTEDLVAVEVNGQILSKEEKQTYKLSDADEIELIRFVGGG